MSKISCIIAAHNEEPRIGNVLKAISGHHLVSEIIVVDDGSRDGTVDVVKKFSGVRLIALEKNRGKSNAVAEGLKEAKGKFIFTLDADLEGLTPKNIADLLEPVATGQADVSISLRGNSPWIDRVIGLDYISGERVFPRSYVSDRIEDIKKLPRFGLEVFFNRIIINKEARIKIVYWEKVRSPMKFEKDKRGKLSGVWGDVKMIGNIMQVISPLEVAYQFAAMTKLKVK